MDCNTRCYGRPHQPDLVKVYPVVSEVIFLTVWSFVASCVGVTLGAAVQLYLSLILYPQATYSGGPIIQFNYNLNVVRMAINFIFLLPTIFTIFVLLLPRKRNMDEAMLLVAPTAAYFLIIFTIGHIEEVRLFLPFVFPLLPATAEVIVTEALRLRPHSASGTTIIEMQ